MANTRCGVCMGLSPRWTNAIFSNEYGVYHEFVSPLERRSGTLPLPPQLKQRPFSCYLLVAEPTALPGQVCVDRLFAATEFPYPLSPLPQCQLSI